MNDQIDGEEAKSSDQSFEEVKEDIKEKRKAFKESMGSTKKLKMEQIEDIKEQRMERKQYQENQILYQTLLLGMIKENQKSIKQMAQGQPNNTAIQTNLNSPNSTFSQQNIPSNQQRIEKLEENAKEMSTKLDKILGLLMEKLDQ